MTAYASAIKVSGRESNKQNTIIGIPSRGERVQFVLENAKKIQEMHQLLKKEMSYKNQNAKDIARWNKIIAGCKSSTVDHLVQIVKTKKDKDNIEEITKQIHQWMDEEKYDDINFMLLNLLYNGNPGKYGQQLAIIKRQRGL